MSLFPAISLKTDLSDVYEEIGKFDIEIDAKIRTALELVGQSIIAYLQESGPEHGTTIDPDNPVKQGPAPPIASTEGERDRHPGGFADRTGRLNRGYSYRVFRRGTTWILRLSNNTEYAAYLDDMEGYYVLSGVADRPDSPGMKELRKALRRILPDWKITA